MPRICKICAYPDQAAVKAAFASGAPDRELAQRFGVSHMAIGRHRRAHIVRPMVAAVAALDRGRARRQQREQQLAAIEQGDPLAIATAAFSAPRQLAKITEAESRLTRLADAAEASGAVTAATQVVSQQLKSVEIGSRIAQTGGYGAVHVAGQSGEARTLSITMVFPNAGRTESMTIIETPKQPSDTRLEIDVKPDADEDTLED
jgi:hypothetical protein